MNDTGILKRAVWNGGVIVLAVGAVSRDYYVAYNGRIAHKGSDFLVAVRCFNTLAPTSALILSDSREGGNGSLEV